MKVSTINIKIYTEFYKEQLNEGLIYCHPLWYRFMSLHPFIIGYYDDQGQLLAVWPFNMLKRMTGVKCLSQPPFSQSLGPLFNKDISKNRSELSSRSIKRKIIEAFLVYLKDEGFNCISQGLPPDFSFAQYFNHRGFRLQYRITYRIDAEESVDAVWANMHPDHRRKIRKAKKAFHLEENCTAEDLWSLKKEQLPKTSLQNLINRENFIAAVEGMVNEQCGYIIGVKNKTGHWQSMAFFGEDDQMTYYLVGATQKSAKSHSPSLLLLWEGIQRAIKRGNSFDFEGTMVAQLDRNFRRFAPQVVPYARLEYDTTFIGRLIRFWKEGKKKI